ncbi:Helix-turn-helix [Sphingomonas guangdongensis]|uniref:Helix-turn-helix n=1 Tax=Sphingomonas guangdongensis TaxID=1141890 RepID=A0A285QGW7_9SPHN|nr:DNA N-6-adenine-methyltransferase [Sphingomonas guangdongensis]SOB80758.1 Helix-turn-helix [Sphingomonas guangdongensis]
MTDHNLTRQLREARRSQGLTQSALAGRIAVTQQVIKRLEAGTGSVQTLVAVMDALDFRLTGLAPGRTLAEQLRAARQRRSLSLSTLATKADVSRKTLASLEEGGGTVASLERMLAVLAPKVRRRAQERAYWGQGDKEDRDSRFTPPEFLAMIEQAFGEIDLDPCANTLSSVVAGREILLSEGGDGLRDGWSGKLAYVNPPFSEQLTWLRRAHDQWQIGNVKTVVCLVPARFDSAWFHSTLSPVAHIYLLQGRVPFLTPSGKRQHTPFSLAFVALGSTTEQREAFARLAPGYRISRQPT